MSQTVRLGTFHRLFQSACSL